MLSSHKSFDASLTFDLVIPALPAMNHKQVLRLAALEVSKIIGISDRILTERLQDREKEYPAAIGDGAAIMHLQMSGLKNTLSVFIRLRQPVAMNAPDKTDVDLVCLLLTPEREGSAYLRSLARASRMLRNAPVCLKLRNAADEKAIRLILEQSSSALMAA